MVNTCTCNKECSSTKQGFESLRIHSFPKKLLVAISVAVIIAMCLRPAEAASIERRHRIRDNMPKATKDILARDAQDPTQYRRKRHDGQSGANASKEQGPNKKRRDLLDKLQKVVNKIEYTRDKFTLSRTALKELESEDYGSGMPIWLPKTNFVEIHFHKYGKFHKNVAAKTKKIFDFLIRRLYKSLLDYYELFKRFKNVEVSSPDTEIHRYNARRNQIFVQTTNDLYSTIEDIKDTMTSVNMTKWQSIAGNTSNIHSVELLVDGARYLKYDNILMRAYGNVLDNWHYEFNCSKFRRTKSRSMSPDLKRQCKLYNNSLKKKRHDRNKHKRVALSSSKL